MHYLFPDSPKVIDQTTKIRARWLPSQEENHKFSIIFIAASIGCLQYFQKLQETNPQFSSELSDELKESLKQTAQSYTEIVALLNSSSEHVET